MTVYRFDGDKQQGQRTQYIETPDIDSIMRKVARGQTIDLSPVQEGILSQAYIMTLASEEPPTAPAIGRNVVVYGTPDDGETLIWDESEGEWVPGAGGGGGGTGTLPENAVVSNLWDGSAYPARPTANVVMWVGPTAPTIGGAGNAVNGDVWVDSAS